MKNRQILPADRRQPAGRFSPSSHRRRRRRGLQLGPVLVLAAVLAAAVVVWKHPFDKGEPAAAAKPQGFVVAVDPGHGGGDSGAVGVLFDESEMTWRTAQDLMELLEADDRFSPFLTTDGSEYSEPSERAAFARQQGAQLLISIHGNSGSDPSYAGFECYPVPPGRTYNGDSLDFAERIAQGFLQAGATLRGQGGVRYVYYDAQDQKHFAEADDTTVRTEQSFTLLEECGCPAVLAEQCFVTSPEDAQAFGSEEGCRVAAGIYYDAICSWYQDHREGQTSADSLL